MQMSDKEIIEHVINGEKEYFKELMMRYENKVYKTAYGITMSVEDTKDVVQDVFLKVYSNLASFNYKSTFLTWLLRITYTTSIDIIKHRNKNKHDALNLNMAKNGEEHNIDKKIIMERALGKLTERERTVFLLHGRDGYKHREIADILGVREGTVKALYFRSLDKLRSELEGKI